MESRISVNLEKVSHAANASLYIFTIGFFLLGHFVSFYFHFGTVIFFLSVLINLYFLHGQKQHALLSNFGFLAQMRYIIESIGPEFRQYLYMSDTEERPFNRIERAEVYRKSKNMDSSSAFGSLNNFDHREIKLRHSMFPRRKSEQSPFSVTFGEERSLSSAYAIKKPMMISAMSYGALSSRAVRSLARGAKKAGIPMNTGEGGYPKHHLAEGCDLIFQMGTAKFGVRNDDGSLNDEKLSEIAALEQVKMIEIKLSQGAKPGKGGLLPKEKITEEISQLRGVPMGADVISPRGHVECSSPGNTVKFIQHVQEISGLPVGIKMCLGRADEFSNLLKEMKQQKVYPDYMVIDGSEGGTGAAPKPFMDDIGVPIYKALPFVNELLMEYDLRDKTKLVASGKLINAGRQFIAMSFGANAIYSARGFMLAIGCIQAMQCNSNTCPVGITSHSPKLYTGIDIEVKSERVASYVNNIAHDHEEILASLGKGSHAELNKENLLIPEFY
ncbi:MAG: FMN-binding glutamate synthase family protein [Oligoflexales bacterium]